MIRKADLIDVLERRSMPVETFEFRSVGSNAVRMEGYASIFDKGYDIYGGPDQGGGQHPAHPAVKPPPEVHPPSKAEGGGLPETGRGNDRFCDAFPGRHSGAELSGAS